MVSITIENEKRELIPISIADDYTVYMTADKGHLYEKVNDYLYHAGVDERNEHVDAVLDKCSAVSIVVPFTAKYCGQDYKMITRYTLMPDATVWEYTRPAVYSNVVQPILVKHYGSFGMLKELRNREFALDSVIEDAFSVDSDKNAEAKRNMLVEEYRKSIGVVETEKVPNKPKQFNAREQPLAPVGKGYYIREVATTVGKDGVLERISYPLTTGGKRISFPTRADAIEYLVSKGYTKHKDNGSRDQYYFTNNGDDSHRFYPRKITTRRRQRK